MIFLTGSCNSDNRATLIAAGIGLMAQPRSGYERHIRSFPCYAADNGAYRDKWVEDEWIRWLEKLPRERCLFVVSPDVYPDAVASLQRGLEFAPTIRELGFPVAIVAQDGAEKLTWPWDDIDCIFIGGQRTENARLEWKESDEARQLAREARRHGKWVHVGRVNTLPRLLRWNDLAHSVDGTFLKYGPISLLPRLLRNLALASATPNLFSLGVEGPSHFNHREALNNA